MRNTILLVLTFALLFSVEIYAQKKATKKKAKPNTTKTETKKESTDELIEQNRNESPNVLKKNPNLKGNAKDNYLDLGIGLANATAFAEIVEDDGIAGFTFPIRISYILDGKFISLDFYKTNQGDGIYEVNFLVGGHMKGRVGYFKYGCGIGYMGTEYTDNISIPLELGAGVFFSRYFALEFQLRTGYTFGDIGYMLLGGGLLFKFNI